MDRAKNAVDEHYIMDDDTYCPGCSWLLVSPGKGFLQCNARAHVNVHPDTSLKLPIEWLKIDKQYDGVFNYENGFIRAFLNSSVIKFDTYTPLNLKKIFFRW